MLEAARARAEVESADLHLVPGEAKALPFADQTFDRVIAVTVLCFIPQADQAIAEMARVLKPSGRLVIGELGRWSPWAAIRRVRGWLGAPTWKTARFRTVGELRKLLGGAWTERPRNTRFGVLSALRSRCFADLLHRPMAGPTNHNRRSLHRAIGNETLNSICLSTPLPS